MIFGPASVQVSPDPYFLQGSNTVTHQTMNMYRGHQAAMTRSKLEDSCKLFASRGNWASPSPSPKPFYTTSRGKFQRQFAFETLLEKSHS